MNTAVDPTTLNNTNILLLGIFSSAVIALSIVAVIYFINRGIRRWMKRPGDDAAVEKKLEAGDTLHADGVLGRRHPEEGGLPLRQEQKPRPKAPNPPVIHH